MNYETIKRIASERGVKVEKLIALARQNDPFYMGTKSDHMWGEWFANIFKEYGYKHGVHLRRIHYAITMQAEDVYMPNGEPYRNTDKCWDKITVAAKIARYLGLVDAGLFVDKRTLEPIKHSVYHNDKAEIEILSRKWQVNLALPDFPEPPNYHLASFEPNQRYHIEVWCEKSTMNDILEPICKEFGATLQIGLGEMSITRTLELVKRLNEYDKPARIFYVSDFDPAGQSIPVAVARKIEFYTQELELDLDVKLFPVMLTEQQIERYNLPRKPVKKSERRKNSFEARYGIGATELDALEVIHPGLMGQILRDALSEYYDSELHWKTYNTKNAIIEELGIVADDVLSLYKDEIAELKTEYKAIRADIGERLSAFNKRRQALWQVICDNLTKRQPVLDLIVPKAGCAQERHDALFDSNRDYFEQLKNYKEFQRK